MELSSQQYERIDQYLNGSMTAAEEELFLAEVHQNAAMAEHLAFEQKLRDQLLLLEMETDFSGIEVEDLPENADPAEVADIRERIRLAGEEWKTAQKPEPQQEDDETPVMVVIPVRKPTRWAKYILAAASVLAVAMAVIWLLTNRTKQPAKAVRRNDTAGKTGPVIAKDQPDTTRKTIQPPRKKAADYRALAKTYYKKEQAPPPEEVPQYLRKALMDYNDDNYENLLTMVNVDEPPVARGPTDETQAIKEVGHYYKGLAQLETNKTQEAITNLQWVADSAKTEAVKIKAKWYLMLAFLQIGKVEKAKPLLQELSTQKKNQPYNRQAKALQDSVKQ